MYSLYVCISTMCCCRYNRTTLRSRPFVSSSGTGSLSGDGLMMNSSVHQHVKPPSSASRAYSCGQGYFASERCCCGLPLGSATRMCTLGYYTILYYQVVTRSVMRPLSLRCPLNSLRRLNGHVVTVVVALFSLFSQTKQQAASSKRQRQRQSRAEQSRLGSSGLAPPPPFELITVLGKVLGPPPPPALAPRETRAQNVSQLSPTCVPMASFHVIWRGPFLATLCTFGYVCMYVCTYV